MFALILLCLSLTTAAIARVEYFNDVSLSASCATYYDFSSSVLDLYHGEDNVTNVDYDAGKDYADLYNIMYIYN